jgi:hypothetical protein
MEAKVKEASSACAGIDLVRAERGLAAHPDVWLKGCTGTLQRPLAHAAEHRAVDLLAVLAEDRNVWPKWLEARAARPRAPATAARKLGRADEANGPHHQVAAAR